MKKRYYLYLLSAVLILAYYFRIYRIDGTSMNYQLLQNDIVIAYRQFADIKRGDILVMRHPLDPENTAIPLGKLISHIEENSKTQNVIFIDACFSGIARSIEPSEGWKNAHPWRNEQNHGAI